MFLKAWFKKGGHTKDERETSPRVLNMRRRRLLQFGAVGGGAFLVAWFLRPLLSLLKEGIPFEKETLFENFRVVETNKELQFYDRKSNEAIFILEK